MRTLIPRWTWGERALHGPRRLRREVPGLFADPARARDIERALGAIEGVARAEANPRTGRILVVLAAPDAELASRIKGALRAMADDAAPPPPSLRRVVRGAIRAATDRLEQRQERRWIERVVGREEEGDRGEPWHARPVSAIALALGVDPARGLAPAEARARLLEVGPNTLPGLRARSRGEIFAAQVVTFPVALLGGAVALSALLGDLLEAGAIALVIGVNVAVGYLVEARAEELLHAWRSLRPEWARVRRGGVEARVRAADLVPGDVLLVRAGEAISADARVVAARDLSVDESMLTGESEPAEKDAAPTPEELPVADRHDMIYTGATVAGGDGEAIVVATGARTELGELQRALSLPDGSRAPLERQLSELGERLAVLSLASTGVVAAFGVLRGRSLRAILENAVALGVAAIPEGLPAAGTTALALASRRLFARGIVIRRLAAAETLGSVSVVCADKTGTLTENRMRVTELFLPGEGEVQVGWRGARALDLHRDGGGAPSPERLYEIARIAALNSDVRISEAGEIVEGSGTERALAELALGLGYPVARRRSLVRRIGEQRRSHDRPFMVTMHEHPELGRIELVKGAPEEVLDRCRVSPAERALLDRENTAMASRGLRVLALAWRRNGRRGSSEPYDFAGLVGMHDPVRPGVREALARLGRAGIRTVMLTGDQRATAVAIGAELGIAPEAIHSRVTPADKLDVVEQLQRQGRVVAMTGDGVNDGPALKAADVGVAMGERGTDVARAVADVVLAHDDLPSLAGAVEEGRRLYDNIRRAIDYLVATNTSEVLVSVVGSALATPALGPLQLLWLNILTDVVPALALALEPADQDVMDRPPRDPGRPLLDRRDYRRLGAEAGGMTLASLGAYAVGSLRGGPARAAPLAFVALAVAQILHARACRAWAPAPNPYLAWATAGAMGAQGIALAAPSLRRALVGGRLPAGDLAIALIAGAIPTLRREGGALVREPRDAIVVTHQEVFA